MTDGRSARVDVILCGSERSLSAFDLFPFSQGLTFFMLRQILREMGEARPVTVQGFVDMFVFGYNISRLKVILLCMARTTCS